MAKLEISWTETIDCSAVIEVDTADMSQAQLLEDLDKMEDCNHKWFELLQQQMPEDSCMCEHLRTVEHRQLLSAEVIHDDDKDS